MGEGNDDIYTPNCRQSCLKEGLPMKKVVLYMPLQLDNHHKIEFMNNKVHNFQVIDSSIIV
jgi:hypothetical protein